MAWGAGLFQAHGRHGAALDGAVAGRNQHALARHLADAHDGAAAEHGLLAVVVVHAQARQALSSRKLLPWSSRRATRSRGSNWPFSRTCPCFGGGFRHHLALQGLHLRQPFGHALMVAAKGVGARSIWERICVMV